MQNTLFALSLGFAGLILAAQALQAAPQCAPRDRVTTILADTYGETRSGIGLNGSDQVMELFTNPATGSWTILITLPAGAACLIVSGTGYEPVTTPLPAKGDPA